MHQPSLPTSVNFPPGSERVQASGPVLTVKKGTQHLSVLQAPPVTLHTQPGPDPLIGFTQTGPQGHWASFSSLSWNPHPDLVAGMACPYHPKCRLQVTRSSSLSVCTQVEGSMFTYRSSGQHGPVGEAKVVLIGTGFVPTSYPPMPSE